MSCRIDCGWAAVVQFWVLGVGFTFGEWVWDGCVTFETLGSGVGVLMHFNLSDIAIHWRKDLYLAAFDTL
jgi:hypothetical protein